MTTITITDVRPNLRKLADRVCHHGERICIERNGEPVFVMVSYEDVQALEALEDALDIEAVKEALKEGGFIALDDLIKELKL